MKVFKFGGASVKDANAVRNIGEILAKYTDNQLIVVISAMGKMTNAFEWLINSYCYGNGKVKESLDEIVDFHNIILWELFPNKNHQVYIDINELLFQIEEILNFDFDKDYDKTYDSLVGYGELISTKIVSHYLNSIGISNTWLDARQIIKTNSDFRQAKVEWDITQKKCNNTNFNLLTITQGFIGSSNSSEMTTLGREGSDFTAAIFGFCNDAESVTIWKDVSGVLNADPKHFPEATLIKKLSYREAIELSYYGASVIHPKTIKPLENKGIELCVKSFINPKKGGTTVQKLTEFDSLKPSYIFIKNQILVSISPKDFSFIAEDNLSFIFDKLAQAKIKVNLIQNSALSFSVCFKNEETKVTSFFESIEDQFTVKYNNEVTLLTIRHYSEEVLDKMTKNKEIYLEQKSRHTARYVMK